MKGRPTISKKGPRVRVSIAFDPTLLAYVDKHAKGNRSQWINALIQAHKDVQK